MDYKKLILRIKCPEIRECPFREPMSCTKCIDAVGEDSIFAITYLLDELSELEAKNIRLQGQVENANVACAKWEGLFRVELEKNPVWVSINDKMPEKDEEVLLRFESGNMAVGWWDSFSECIVDWYCYAGDNFYEYCFDTPTHWMPLPEPPKEV